MCGGGKRSTHWFPSKNWWDTEETFIVTRLLGWSDLVKFYFTYCNYSRSQNGLCVIHKLLPVGGDVKEVCQRESVGLPSSSFLHNRFISWGKQTARSRWTKCTDKDTPIMEQCYCNMRLWSPGYLSPGRFYFSNISTGSKLETDHPRGHQSGSRSVISLLVWRLRPYRLAEFKFVTVFGFDVVPLFSLLLPLYIWTCYNLKGKVPEGSISRVFYWSEQLLIIGVRALRGSNPPARPGRMTPGTTFSTFPRVPVVLPSP